MVESMPSDIIKSTVEGLLAVLGAKIDAIRILDGTRTVVAVDSPDAAILVGQKGENLQALNTLARRLVEAKMRMEEISTPSDSINFLIDVNGYHEAKLKELRANARLSADRAKMFRHEVELPPMSSYERLVVHEMFAGDPEIETASSGEGKFRHVVLKYKIQDSGFTIQE